MRNLADCATSKHQPQRKLDLPAGRARPGNLSGRRIPGVRVSENRQVRNFRNRKVRMIESVENLGPELKRAIVIAAEVKILNDRRIEGEKTWAGDHVAAQRTPKSNRRQNEDARIEKLCLADIGWNTGDSGREIRPLLVVGRAVSILIEGKDGRDGNPGLGRQNSAQLPTRKQRAL